MALWHLQSLLGVRSPGTKDLGVKNDSGGIPESEATAVLEDMGSSKALP